MKKTLTTTLLLLSILIYAQNGKKDKFDNNLYKGKYSNKDFFEKAEYIFEGEYVESETYFVDDSTKVYTQYLLKVNEVYKGNKKLKKGTVTLIKNSGSVSKMYKDEKGELVILNKDYNNQLDFDIHGKNIFFCSESDLEMNSVQLNSSNTIKLKLLHNYEYANLIIDEDLLEEYNFLISGLNNLYFKDKQEFYNYAKQYKGLNIPKLKKKENQEKALNKFMKKQYQLLEIAKKNKLKAIKSNTELTISIVNREVTGEDTAFFEFDVMAATNQNLYYSGAMMRLSYNTDLFGNEIVYNQNIELSIAEGIDSLTLEAGVFDFSDNVIHLGLTEKENLNSWNRPLITSAGKILFHVKIAIPNQLPAKTEHYTNLFFTDIDFTSNFSYYTNTSTESTLNTLPFYKNGG